MDPNGNNANKSNEILITRPTSCTPDSGTGSGGNSMGSGGSSNSSISGDRFSPFPCNPASNQSALFSDISCYEVLPTFVDHPLTSVVGPDSRKTSESSSSVYEDNPLCAEHHLAKDYFCYTCTWEVCVECIKKEHNEHYLYPGLSCKELFEETDKVRKIVKENMSLIERQINCLQYRKLVTTSGIQQFFNKLHDLVALRERQLVTAANYVADCRLRALDQKFKEHQTAVAHSLQTTDGLLDSLKSGNPDYILQTSRNAKKNLEMLRRIQRNFQYSDEQVTFIPPDESILNIIKEIGTVSGPTPAPAVATFGRAVGECPGVYDVVSSFQSFSPFSPLAPVPLFPKSPGVIGSGIPKTTIDLASNNFPVSFHTNRSYSRIKKPVTVFGTEGSNDGELCRPWGVCCDSNGHVIVADRSNNRIQIFRLDGSFVRKFGTPGNHDGELNRPAGVAMDYYGRIVVTDKDNHRVQIFTMEGEFVFSFGERGQANGKFHYPWDVAVSSAGSIVISDTRNHRIQMFSGNGMFLKKFGFENMSNMWKFFDSPRGVCFTANNTVLVTDFNNHKLYEIDMEKAPKLVNCENYKKCELFRPQGVAVDEDGNILVADCRNNRIQVFDKNGQSVGQFGVAGKEHGQFDRPSGIALTSDGKIIVVDFGNHRVQIF